MSHPFELPPLRPPTEGALRTGNTGTTSHRVYSSRRRKTPSHIELGRKNVGVRGHYSEQSFGESGQLEASHNDLKSRNSVRSLSAKARYFSLEDDDYEISRPLTSKSYMETNNVSLQNDDHGSNLAITENQETQPDGHRAKTRERIIMSAPPTRQEHRLGQVNWDQADNDANQSTVGTKTAPLPANFEDSDDYLRHVLLNDEYSFLDRMHSDPRAELEATQTEGKLLGTCLREIIKQVKSFHQPMHYKSDRTHILLLMTTKITRIFVFIYCHSNCF